MVPQETVIDDAPKAKPLSDIESRRAERSRYNAAEEAVVEKSKDTKPAKQEHPNLEAPTKSDGAENTDHPQDEVNKQENKNTEESKSEHEPNEEPTTDDLDILKKRVSDKERDVVETRTKLNQLQKKLEASERLLERFKDFVEYDENGLPKNWNIPEKSDTHEDPEPKPVKEPDWDELELLTAKEAYEKRKAYDDYVRERKSWELRQKAKQEKAETAKKAEEESRLTSEQQQFMDTWNNSLKFADAEFEGAADETSELNKAAAKILMENGLDANPNGPLIAVRLAAQELGIKPKSSNNEKPPAETKPKPKDKTYITSIGSEGRNTSPSLSPREQKLNAMREKRRRFSVEYGE